MSPRQESLCELTAGVGVLFGEITEIAWKVHSARGGSHHQQEPLFSLPIPFFRG